MKKNLVIALALVFVLGIAGTAFAAANPFTDVPAKHWAYDAVSKLAKAGILDGYGDGTYRGERTATRYEMAQATAKAMARADKADAQMKALIDKLAVEFAAELNNLGVRVAKLEKNASSIKFWGDARLRWQSGYGGEWDVNGTKGKSRVDERIRVYARADVNDKAFFAGRLAANWYDNTGYNGSAQSEVYWDFGYFQWNFDPSFAVAAGRQQAVAGYMFATNGGWDAINFKFGAPSDKFKATIGYGDIGSYSSGNGALSPFADTLASSKPLLVADLNYQVNKDWKVNGFAYYSTNADQFTGFTSTNGYAYGFEGGYPFQTYGLGVKGNLTEDLGFTGQYFWNGAAVNFANGYQLNDSKNGYAVELQFKGAQAAKVGSWGLAVNYRDIKPFAIDAFNYGGILGNDANVAKEILYGKKGWGAWVNYTISKNAVLQFNYSSLSANNSNANIYNSTNYVPFYYLQLGIGF